MAPKFAEDTVMLWRVRRTILQMLRDRHYNVDDSDLKMNLNEFADRFGQSVNRDDLIIKTPKTDDRNDHIFVFFIGEAKVGVKIMRAYAERMRSENVLRGILVVREQLTPSSKQWIQDFNVKFHMEVFREEELLVNVTEHDLVPEHEVLTSEEKKKLLEHYKVKETQWVAKQAGMLYLSNVFSSEWYFNMNAQYWNHRNVHQIMCSEACTR